MKNKFENILLSILLGMSVLLGLSFWLSVNYSFNLFSKKHWDELSQLQVSHTPINNGFYFSIIIAILIFVIGIYVIYKPIHNKQPKPSITTSPQKNDINISVPDAQKNNISSEPIQQIPVARPPRLNLPKNMGQIVAQRHQELSETKQLPKNPEQNPYNSVIAQIFSDNGYTVKPNPKISDITPNLFAIGPNEVLWIGGIDITIDEMQNMVEKLESVFQETLEDIKININAFILDTSNQIQQTNDSILVFKSVDDLKEFITQNPAEDITDEERDNFDSYSEYIDTVIQYIKNI